MKKMHLSYRIHNKMTNTLSDDKIITPESYNDAIEMATDTLETNKRIQAATHGELELADATAVWLDDDEVQNACMSLNLTNYLAPKKEKPETLEEETNIEDLVNAIVKALEDKFEEEMPYLTLPEWMRDVVEDAVLAQA